MHLSPAESLPPLQSVILAILTIDFLRYFLAAGLIWLIVTVFRRTLAARRILGGTPRAGQMRREFIYSLSTVTIFAASGTLVFLGSMVGWFKTYDDVALYGWGWWWASVALVIVAHDAYFYWTHRWLHHPRNTVGHSGYELMPWLQTRSGWLRWITPVIHHHFHHARNRGNFGLYFTWWDRLCGTEDGEYLVYGDAQFK